MTAKNELRSSSKPEPINRQQITILIVLCYGNFWSNACFSLIAPFFPKEAEAKGATPTQYGLILSVYQFMYLIHIIMAPIFAKCAACLSPTIFCSLALFIESLSYISFGFLICVPNGIPFIELSFLLRMTSGVTSAINLSASFSIIVKNFPNQPVLMTSVLSATVGLGLIGGPTLGGAIYQWGGFIFPFVIFGVFLIVGAILVILLIPRTSEESPCKSNSIWCCISDIGGILDALIIVKASVFLGFNATTFENHLRQFGLQPIIIGCIFTTSVIVYCVTSLFWAQLCSRGWEPRKLCLLGNFLCIMGFLFIGPQIFVDLETQLWLILVSLVFISLGITANMITSFDSLFKDCVNRRGLPTDISTYGTLFTFYLFSYSFGAIVGSTLGGFLLERGGYRKSTFPLFILEIVMTFLVLVYILYNSFLVSHKKKFNFDNIYSDDHRGNLKY